MKREADIEVRSLQYTDGEPQRMYSVCRGAVRDDGERTELNYTEDLGDGTVTDCSVETDGEKLVVRRTGGAETTLVIVPGATHETSYATEAGSFRMRVTGKKISVKKNEKSIEITAYYYIGFTQDDDILHKVTIRAVYGDIKK